MGKYLNNIKGTTLPALGKAKEIINLIPEAQVIAQPTEFTENLVCVANNGAFEAAAYCYSDREFEEFRRYDGRQKTWLVVPNAAEYARG